METTSSGPGPVVVGVDRSDGAREAVAWAADLASVWGSVLHLVHAMPVEPDTTESRPWFGALLDIAERVGCERPHAELRQGDPVEVLTERGADARMLVLGGYGEGARAGMLAGSVALALVGHAACPLAVVRGRSPRVPPPSSGPVVVGVDGSPAGRAALGLAAVLAVSLGAPLVAVHSWTDVVSGPFGTSRRPEGPEFLAAEGAARLDAELATLAASYPALAVERHVAEDTPLRALLDRAENARLLVVGNRGPDRRTGMLSGSTSRALVEFAACPVVVTTPPAAVLAGPVAHPARAVR